MKAPGSKKSSTAQEIIRDVIELCADCDTCREMMVEDCVFFVELYRLWDSEKEDGVPITEADLRNLVDLCTHCGLCPCPKIPVRLMEAKSRYVDQEGLPLATRILIDVPRLAKLCGTFPKLVNALQSNKAVAPLLHKITGTHPERQFPPFPEQSFFQWAAQRGLTERKEGKCNLAYFAGCTAGYLFPQVGRATVEVLERNGVTVYVPPQQCCGMPHLVEGDRNGALEQVRANMDPLLAAVRAGDDLVCSCPTCGYFLKVLLRDRVYYSEAYQRSMQAGKNEIKVPEGGRSGAKHKVLSKLVYNNILQDDGYFAELDPMARIELGEHVFDAGEFLARLHSEGRLDTRFAAISERMVYFAPCHQREQRMGRPYLDLLALIPGLTVEAVGESECCGMGGNFGFKAAFHEKSLAVGQPVMERIKEKAPQAIVTDCMSCSLQFSHALPYPVFHPLEILARAYRSEDTHTS